MSWNQFCTDRGATRLSNCGAWPLCCKAAKMVGSKASGPMRRIWMAARPAMLFASAMLLAGAAAANDASAALDQAERLIREGHAKEAIALLAPLEAAHAGDQRFDYLLGTAMLIAGHPDQASLALERAVAVNPLHAAARLELARAYYLLGDLQRAKTEFETAAQLDPPPAARSTIQQYLQAITAKETPAKIKTSAYLEITTGYDSNVNNAPNQSRVAIPALDDLVVTLNPSNIQTGDGLYGLATGGEIEVPISDNISWTLAANANRRDNFKQSAFATAATDIRTGLAFSQANHSGQLSVLSGRMYLGGRLNRTIEGAAGEWRELLNPSTQLGLAVQYLRYRFPSPELVANSFNQWSGALSCTHLMDNGKLALSTDLLFGHERDTDHRADGVKDIYGIQAGGRQSWNEKIDGYLKFGWTTGHYGSINPAFEKKRRDDEYHATAGVAYRFTERISARSEISFSRNRSNLAIFDFRETVLLFKLRYDMQE